MKTIERTSLTVLAFMLAYALASESEVDRLTAMCNSLSPGMAANVVRAKLAEAGHFRVHGVNSLAEAGAPTSWFFVSTRFPLFPAASCHVEQRGDTVTEAHVFRD